MKNKDKNIVKSYIILFISYFVEKWMINLLPYNVRKKKFGNDGEVVLVEI